jgi:nucleoside-diphosphate-sugar epimerase
VDREPDAASARYDMASAARDFGYQPKVSIDEGLARLAAACRGT